ncbi:MAG: DNA-protecting protein DprA [Ferruginibacter sp.]|nr:DNA-protecting protein DprA [Cytophagales bacterium]
MDEKLHQLALTLTPGIGDVLIRQLISYCGAASEVFRSGSAKLTRIPGVGEGIAQGIQRQRQTALQAAEVELRLAEKYQVRLLFYTDADFPHRLKRLYDAPVLLYYRGNADLNAAKTLGIVGTRQATDYGRGLTEEIVKELQPFNPLVVSGLAYGIDIAAHRACLKYQVATLGVMATGMDIVYPPTHQKTARAMEEQGGLLTENRFGGQPDAHRFPARNRIIAGLSDALIVVEASVKGGALITAEYANNYHKEVFAVPGDVHRPYSVGCNKLIQQNKAAIFTNVRDLKEMLNWDNQPKNGSDGADASKPFMADSLLFTGEESQVIALLRTQPDMLMDDLSWQSQIPVNRLASLLLNLEFQGVVKAMPGKKFALA